MKLYWAPASPYARKARMVIAERELGSLVEEIIVPPYDDPPELIAANPLGKVPALLTDDGLTLFDSPVICAYLDVHCQAKGERLRPHSGGATLGHLAIGAALGYLDLRHDELGWRNGRDELARWYAEIAERPSFIATTPS